jgi:hypothetical protein
MNRALTDWLYPPQEAQGDVEAIGPHRPEAWIQGGHLPQPRRQGPPHSQRKLNR